MTSADLKTRIEQHKAARTRLISQISAYDGAIQEAEHWLEISLTAELDTRNGQNND